MLDGLRFRLNDLLSTDDHDRHARVRVARRVENVAHDVMDVPSA